MKKKDKNAETNETGKKKKKLPIIITLIALILIIGSCGSKGSSNNDDSSSESNVSESSSESEVITEQETATTTTITTTLTVKSTAKEITTIVSTTAIDISPESFVNAVEETIQSAVGEDEYITDVSLIDGILTISVDLSKADTSIVPIQDLAVVRAQSITDNFLDLNRYDDLWKEIIVDFGDIGFVKRTQSDISQIITGGQTLRYFEIDELDSPDDVTATNTTKVVDLTKKAEITSLEHGELLDVTTIAGPLVIKAKIEPSFTNELTINQNYMNVADVILNQGGNQFDEIQYWAVADMTDGSESKVISFTLDKSTIDGVYNGNIIDIQLGDYVTDLWILPSLQN